MLTFADTARYYNRHWQGLLRFAEAIKRMHAMLKECVRFAKAVKIAAATLRQVKERLDRGGEDATRMRLDILAREENKNLLLDFAKSVDGGAELVDKIAADDWCCGLECLGYCGTVRRLMRATRYSEELKRTKEDMETFKYEISTRLLVELHLGMDRVLVQLDSLLVSNTTSIYFGIPISLPALLGREVETQELSAALASPGTIASLTGIAGAGKSQLAYRHAYRFAFNADNKPRDDRVVLVLDAATDEKHETEETKLVNSYTEALAALSNLSPSKIGKLKVTTQQLADRLLEAVIKRKSESLIVFDNVPNVGAAWLRPRFFSSLRGATNVRILLTSRSDTLKGQVDGIGHIHHVAVGPLRTTAGVALLLGDDDVSEADRAAALQIHEELKGHALALSVTRQFVKDSRVIQRKGLTLHNVAEGLEKADEKVSAALAAPLRFVRESTEYKQSAKMLDVAAFVDPRGIPESLLLRAGGAGCSDEDIGLLCDLNLLQLGPRIPLGASGQMEATYSMHRLLQAAAREGRSAQGALAAVYAEMKLYKEEDVSTWARARALVPHAEALSAWARKGGVADAVDLGRLMHIAGMVWSTAFGKYGQALEAYAQALRIKRAALGDDHLGVASTRNNMGNVYDSQGRYAEALEAYEESLRIKRAALGDDHPDVASTHNNMGNVYQSQGRYAEALEAYEEALRIYRAKLGDDHPEVARTHNGIGNVYASQGRHTEALEAYEEALRIKRAALGDGHPSVALSRIGIGVVYRHQGRYAEALEAYEEALRIDRATLGDDHPNVVTTLNNMAIVYQRQGRYAEALEAYEEDLRITRTALGDDHPSVATTRNNMAIVYDNQGRYTEALEALKEALRIYSAVFREDHPHVTKVRSNIEIVQNLMREQQSDAGAPSTNGSNP